MKHLQKFENIEHKDINQQIDDVLDRLSKKGELSKSEKEFMVAAAKNKITDVTIPNPTGNFWADMANPHNVGILWNNGNEWKQLKSIEDEEDEKLNSSGKSSDEIWEIKQKRNTINYLKSRPGLKEDLEKLIKIENQAVELVENIKKKYPKRYNDKLDNLKTNIETIIHLFGYIEDDGTPKIY